MWRKLFSLLGTLLIGVGVVAVVPFLLGTAIQGLFFFLNWIWAQHWIVISAVSAGLVLLGYTLIRLSNRDKKKDGRNE